MIEDLIIQLKTLVYDLELDEDPITFDNQMAQIDLLIYDIRTKAFSRPLPRPRQDMSTWNKRDMDSWLDELSTEISTNGV